MRRSTRRRLQRFYRDPLTILASVFTIIGAIIIPAIQPSSIWLWLAIASGLAALGWLAVFIHRVVSMAEVEYFEEVHFGEPMECVVIESLWRLLGGEKAQPRYVHAAPRNQEVDTVCQGLGEAGFSTIYGGPGEGKSMTAFHAAHSLNRNGCSVYTLRIDLLAQRPRAAGQFAREPKACHRG
jgi:hypothetical protein